MSMNRVTVYFSGEEGWVQNLGDALVPHLLERLGVRCVAREVSDSTVLNPGRCLLVIGSLLTSSDLRRIEGPIDVWGCGWKGIEAWEGFDASRGLAFSTFAAPRIRGSILDELRKQDHVPRSIRRKTREISAAREAWMKEHGRPPEDRELAAQMNVDMETFWRWQADVEGAHHIPLDRAPGERENSAPAPVEMLPSREESEVEEQLTHEQEVAHLKDAILKLKEQERIVLSLYYFEELKLHEIAKVLELTESRVSQIRSKALSKLRVDLKPLRDNIA